MPETPHNIIMLPPVASNIAVAKPTEPSAAPTAATIAQNPTMNLIIKFYPIHVLPLVQALHSNRELVLNKQLNSNQLVYTHT